ncbi:MAG: hypothetical protein MI702_03255, partial [Chlorobiales bacterium]|nr:hypothetical protein [Chlorobiales bacterium]
MSDRSGKVHTRICLATSSDGINFVRHPDNPVLDIGPQESWDSLNVETAFVIYDNDHFKLYYMGADTEDGEEFISGKKITLGAIGLATSTDGIHFTRYSKKPVLWPSSGDKPGRSGYWDSWGVEGPWVIKNKNGSYWMWYGGVGSVDSARSQTSGIGLAFSEDGIVWEKYAENPVLSESPDQWDAYHVIDPSVIRSGNRYHLWFHGGNVSLNGVNGNFHIGYAYSKDGIHWTKSNANPVLLNGKDGSWNSFAIMAPSIIETTNAWVMYFHGYDGMFPNFSNWSIGRATKIKKIT